VSDLRRQFIGSPSEPERVPPAWYEDRFAEWLRERMAERELTQRMLALRSGLNHSTISRLLDQGRRPSLATALALLHVLGPDPVRFEQVRKDAS